jgi:endonuclease/exonuclease/phosphatase family metal-dependent hydrolase
MAQTVAADLPLPQLGDKGFTLLTYNVLMPNSNDGWWVHKYYGAGVDKDHTEWEYRVKLLRKQMTDDKPDVICIQEATEPSFEADFCVWMREEGYAHELMKKGRMRCATFWRTERFALAVEADPKNGGVQHKDRSLICELVEVNEADKGVDRRSVFIVNCHFTAGPDRKRRLKQAHEAVETVKKTMSKRYKEDQTKKQQEEKRRQHEEKKRLKREADKLKKEAEANKQQQQEQPPQPPQEKQDAGCGADCGAGGGDGDKPKTKSKPKKPKQQQPNKQEQAAAEALYIQSVPVVMCGDFNSGGMTAVRELLVECEVAPEFREDKDATSTAVTSKVAKNALSPFIDAYDEAFKGEGKVSGEHSAVIDLDLIRGLYSYRLVSFSLSLHLFIEPQAADVHRTAARRTHGDNEHYH